MTRYLIDSKDRAEKLERWVESKGKEISDKLKDSVEIQTNLQIREPFKVEKKEYFNGFLGVDMIFGSEQEPKFLTQGNKDLWYSKVKEVGEDRFGVETSQIGCYYGSIPFEEKSEEELYKLTENKKSKIMAGFANIEKFVKWYCLSLEGHKKVVEAHDKKFQKYLDNLKTVS
ncbi:MAG: hypothetical protein AABW50_02245 [Nanoarchaeota archaeon]